jgi:hypothetical protein
VGEDSREKNVCSSGAGTSFKGRPIKVLAISGLMQRERLDFR